MLGALLMVVPCVDTIPGLGAGAGGAAATVDGRVAIDLLEQGVSAIRNAALDHPERAAFADGGATDPRALRRGFRGDADSNEPGGVHKSGHAARMYS